MFVRRLLASSLMIAAVLSLSFASHAANAQGSTCTDAAYVSPISNIATALQNADYAKPNTVGNVLMALISLRYQYEDAAPPTGCESVRPLFLQYLSVQEDSIYTTLAAKIDTANAAAYTDIGTNVAPPRYSTITNALLSTLANVTTTDAAMLPTQSATPNAAAPQACSDAAFAAGVKTDFASLKGGIPTGVTFIKLRYKYEDATAPSGCADGRTFVIQSLAIAEDVAALSVMAQADSANAATYTGFLTNTVIVRAGTYGKTAIAAFPSLAPTAAPTASS